jgi:hypothetical protein
MSTELKEITDEPRSAPVWHREEKPMCPVESVNGLSAIEERIRQFLSARARQTDPSRPFAAKITYQDLCSVIDPDQHYWSWPRFRGIGKVLGRISTWEHDHGRPLLSALVVHAGDLQAGDGFAGLGRSLGYQIQPGQERAFWRGQVEKVVEYWTESAEDHAAETDRLAMIRDKVASVMRELAEIQRLLDEAA